ncbi:hypothetical protein BGX31_000845 [Mortierella sp. GBA43]|nr:hypothetical protein BGX31_000845 [Mortierella sp. GBA43]
MADIQIISRTNLNSTLENIPLSKSSVSDASGSDSSVAALDIITRFHEMPETELQDCPGDPASGPSAPALLVPTTAKEPRSRTFRLIDTFISRGSSNREDSAASKENQDLVSSISSNTVQGSLAHQAISASFTAVSALASPQAIKKNRTTTRARSFSLPGASLANKKFGRSLPNVRTSTTSTSSSSGSSSSIQSVHRRRQRGNSLLKRMLKLTRTNSMPTSMTESSADGTSTRKSGRSSRPRSRTNNFSFPVIPFQRTLSDKDKGSKGIGLHMPKASSSTTSLTSPLSGASLAAIISAIHHGNFLQLSDYNLELLIRTLDGKNSTALESINIKSAAISGSDARLLGKLVRSSNAANIKVLRLDQNAISQEAFKHLFGALKYNSTITVLSMSRSGVDDKAIKHISKALARTETLKELDLSNNRITAQGAQVLCEALIQNRSLTRLCIQSNAIKKVGAPYLAALLARNCVIRHLNVGSNGLGAEGCAMIAGALRLNGTLHSLSLDMNEMGPAGASAIATALASNQHLTHLYIPHNNIGEQGLTEICRNLKNNNSLVGLDLEHNHIGHGQSVVGMKSLAEVLMNNKSLREINLSYNLLSSEGVEELMKGVAANSTLESLILTNCGISTQGAISVAEILPSATGLQNMGLTSNLDIAVEGYWRLATSLSKNRSMKGIQLDYNSEDRHVLYESIQYSLTKNFLWQQAVYTAACQILTLSRIVLLGRPVNQKLMQSQLMQRQRGQSGGAWNILKKVGVGRSSSSNTLASMLTLGKNRVGTEPSPSPSVAASIAQSNAEDGGDDSDAEASTLAPSFMEPAMAAEYNAHRTMANLVNMPYEIFESICAFLDAGQNMSIAQIRATIKIAGDRSTLSESYTRSSTLEKIFQSRYIPPIGMRYGIKNADERM